jgi:flagellum-specific ATP synthase
MDSVMSASNTFVSQIDNLSSSLSRSKFERLGKVTRVVGMTIEASGISAEIGAQTIIEIDGQDRKVEAEVIGFDEKKVFLMPIHFLDGIKAGNVVRVKESESTCSVGKDLLGRVINGSGEPIDGKGIIAYEHEMPLDTHATNPMERGAITDILDTGIKAINGCFAFGKGQRMGLIAGSGVGKSVLLGMLTRNTDADVVVIGLIGERGREVQEFVKNTLGEKGLEKAVVIAAPVDVSPVMRVKAAKLTHSIAEYFSNEGKNVLLLFDSLTRVAHAQREIGLAVGEPPTTKGYTPSVFSLLPKLIERAGVGVGGVGSISAFYTVLAEGDDRSDPIVDLSRATLDGQIMLSRSLADAAHYPAIDLEGSISRLASTLVTANHFRSAQSLRKYWSIYQQKQDLIQVGAYTPNTDPDIDEAIRLKGAIDQFLQQDSSEVVPMAETIKELIRIIDEK